MITVNDIARDKAFDNLNMMSEEDNRLAMLADLDDVDKERFYKILKLAIHKVMSNVVATKGVFAINGIGKIKIKDINKLALVHKNNIAKEMGFDTFREVPKDKLAELNKRAYDLTILDIKDKNKEKELLAEKHSDYKVEKKIPKTRRKSKAKIFKINMNIT
jgi:hypothetical protein